MDGAKGERPVGAGDRKPWITPRRVALVLCVIVLLALNWLALDDITTGSEQSYSFEWAVFFVTLGGIVLGALVGLRRRRR